MIIKRYLAKEILSTLSTVTLILLLAFLSQQLVRYLNYAAIGKIPTNILLELISFETPYLLAILLPLGLFLGILLAYGRLYADHEMTVLQICGFSRHQLIRLTLAIGIFVSIFVLILMCWINPWISGKRQQLMSSDEATLHLIQTLIPGRFQVSPDGRHVMYVGKLSRDHERAENVFLAQEKKREGGGVAWMLVSASQGYQQKDQLSNDQFFVTADGYRYEGTPGQNDYKIIQFKKYEVRIPQNETHLTHQESETLSTIDLWKNYNNPKHAAELGWRISVGLSAFFLALLAVPLSTVRPRRSRFLILLPAILIYIVYFNLLFIARRWMEQSVTANPFGMWWVHGILLIFILLCLLLNEKH